MFTWLHLHKTVLVPQGAPTPRYATRAPSPVSDASDDDDYTTAPAQSTFDAAAAAAGASHFSIYAEARHERQERIKAFLRPCIRVTLACLSIVGALVMPSFEALMSLLGSGFACLTLIVIPVWAGAAVFGWKWYDKVAIVLATLIGVFGTIASFWPS